MVCSAAFFVLAQAVKHRTVESIAAMLGIANGIAEKGHFLTGFIQFFFEWFDNIVH